MKAETLLPVLGGGAVVAALAQGGEPPTVKVNNGTLQGTRCSSTNVTSFLGVPYAQAPLGSLRFAPPQPYNQTYTALDATKPPPACIQFNAAFSEAGAQSEDCLFINVWVPANATTDAALPVKVWLYGGGNAAGGISNPTYDGCTASESVIQVSINYRVGPLGFLCSQALNLTGNQGVQDQLLGLRWVRENIGAFGGDPSRVLLFGQSAGAFDAFVISSLPQAPSLISAAVLESGAGARLPAAAAAQPLSDAFVRGLNCSAADLACARGAPARAVVSSYAAASPGLSGLSSALGLGLGLVVDGAVVAAQPLEAGLKVPAVAGSTTDEGTLFLLAQLQASALELNATAYDGFLASTFGAAAAQLVNQTYPISDYQGSPQPVLAAMSAVITHSRFRCPTRAFLRQAAQDGMPVWTYSFNHTPTCPWYPSIPSAALPLLGSTHTAEIPFVFGGTDGLPRPNGSCGLTAGERALSARMLAAWNGMASDANPGAGWPRYDAGGSMGINVVGDDFSAAAVDYSMCDFWDGLDDGDDDDGGDSSTPGGGNSTAGSGGSGIVTSARSRLESSTMAWAVSFALVLASLGM